ncbi:MAG: L-aspartate oxidase [Candidatus Eisenbacteria sp.]|nr:L-aspartate oxidase [Candidatus Eisenbacteria bacterium]
MPDKRHDFLVIGSGLAGLLFALEASRHGRVAVLAKGEPGDTNTRLAQGGIATVVTADDSFERHTSDTVRTGEGLSHPKVAASVVEEGPRVIEELEHHGVKFARNPGGHSYNLGREGGHSCRRILHANDETGRMIQDALLERLRANRRIELFAGHCAIDLITTSKLEEHTPQRGRTRILGAYVLNAATGKISTFLAPHVLLATGGAGKVYRYTSNPDVACGDGLAMAHRAGARLGNLEFVQFHPTCLYDQRQRRFLISEAVRGEGAILKSISGQPFMKDHHEMGSLAPRDVVARACDQEMKRHGDRHVTLDMSGIDRQRFKRRFPMIYATCLELGLDITRDPVPVVPAAHYMCGGVLTDGMGRTDLVNLYAAGEVACTGLHGANRLASNSLLESAVFALRAARAAGEDHAGSGAGARIPEIPPWNPGQATVPKESILVNAHWEMVRALMWDFVGIERNNHRLALAAKYIHLLREIVERYYWDFILDTDLTELRNISLVAELIISSAAARRESRGLHYNADHPGKGGVEWEREIVLDPTSSEVRLASADEIPFGQVQSPWSQAETETAGR